FKLDAPNQAQGCALKPERWNVATSSSRFRSSSRLVQLVARLLPLSVKKVRREVLPHQQNQPSIHSPRQTAVELSSKNQRLTKNKHKRPAVVPIPKENVRQLFCLRSS